jgi:hypothetical protein
MMRFDDTTEGAWNILQSIVCLKGIVLRLTRQLCIDGLRLKDMDAGNIVRNDLEEASVQKSPK